MENKKNGFLKELWRHFMVSLKRKPYTIPLVALVITFLYYAIHLSSISNTTAKIQGTGMGLAGFCTMLFSMLSFMCFINAFQYRKPVNKPMLILMFVMFGIIAFADVYYLNQIYSAVTREVNPIAVTTSTIYILYAEYYLRWHLILLAVTTVLIVLLPIYSKMLRKVKTSIEVEDNGSLGTIDISGEA
jgi:hypothetical protein